MTQASTQPETSLSKEKRFDWPLCYDAENYVLGQLEAFLGRNHFAKQLSDRMRAESGTLLLDWVDYLTVSPQTEKQLREVGYTEDPAGEPLPDRRAFWHPEAMLPRVLIDRATAESEFPTVVAIRAESMSDFMAAHAILGEPEGEPLSRFRRVSVSVENGTLLEAVERRAYRGFVPVKSRAGEGSAILKAHELWRTRPRAFGVHPLGCQTPLDTLKRGHQTRMESPNENCGDDEKGYGHLQSTLDRVIGLVGRDLACHVVFAEERAYWQRRNRAGQVQKARQDRLGLGWANHDHHTFRSSRRHFVDLMLALEKLGFERRERYYAGAQAGWGAQILEQPVEGIVAFCDVDLEPEETQIHFSRRLLPPSRKLGTIGLWVGLHGESFLDAGMHHLECRFDYELLRDQLAAVEVNTMKPFSDFPFLKQAFTEGEKWPVRRSRAERLLRGGLIDEKQCHQFVTEGAIGSHLENLQRKGGFRGFNQKSVSVIIQATDPRTQARSGT